MYCQYTNTSIYQYRKIIHKFQPTSDTFSWWESTTYRPMAGGTVNLLHTLLCTSQDIATRSRGSSNQNRLSWVSSQPITTQYQRIHQYLWFSFFFYNSDIIWVCYVKKVVRDLTYSALCVKTLTTILAWHT